jgi:hypothetical protein
LSPETRPRLVRRASRRRRVGSVALASKPRASRSYRDSTADASFPWSCGHDLRWAPRRLCSRAICRSSWSTRIRRRKPVAFDALAYETVPGRVFAKGANIAVGAHPPASPLDRRGTQSKLRSFRSSACSDASDDARICSGAPRGWCGSARRRPGSSLACAHRWGVTFAILCSGRSRCAEPAAALSVKRIGSS